MRVRYAKLSGGFTMMEVLVTLVVISLALLGTAGLQTFSVKVGQGGQFRSQAVILGLDILERMEANNAGTIAGNYNAPTLPTSARSNCAVVLCTAANLANYDLAELNSKLVNQLPGSSASVVPKAGVPFGPATFTYTVTINWVERITKQSNVAATGVNAGTTESFAYTVDRTFVNRVL